MAVNLDKPQKWREDIAESVDMYNDWFMKFAPKAFRETRLTVSKTVEKALIDTEFLRDVSPELLERVPGVLQTLRMCTCPPIARDRLVGLAKVSKNLVGSMEDPKNPRVPPKLRFDLRTKELAQIGDIIERMADRDIFVWLSRKDDPTSSEIERASTIIADRLCGAVSDPIIRNAQEARQLKVIGEWLNARKYKLLPPKHGFTLETMPSGTYSFRMNVPIKIKDATEVLKSVNIPVDVVVKPRNAQIGKLPLLFEAKSAGDFTNVNKRRKEEAQKANQLRNTYGSDIQFNLFLCGYFDPGYLGYEASELIDWVWEHRIDDLAMFGL